MSDLTKEQTGKQETTILLPGMGGLGNLGLGGGVFGTTYAGSPNAGYTGSGWVGGGVNPFISPLAALVGTGTLEGTNKYDSSLLAGGLAAGRLAGFGQPFPGTYATYRIMAGFPTIVMAAAAMMMKVMGPPWSYRAKDGAPAGSKEFIEGEIEPLRHEGTWECLKSAIFGWRAFEKVYIGKTAGLGLKKLKPLLPELTTIAGDLGLRNDKEELPPEKVFIYTHDRDCDNYYGRSRMENCRRTWSNYLNAEDNIARLAKKASSIIPHIGYPPGQGIDTDGKQQTNYQIALMAGFGMASGHPVVYPNLSSLQIDDIKDFPELAKASLWSYDTIDMGDPGPAIHGLLELLQYYDKLVVRGWLQPERSLLEAQKGGSRADSQSASDIGTSDASFFLFKIVTAFNQSVIDDLMALNYGEKSRGMVYAEAAPMVDEDKDVDQVILAGIAGNLPLMAKLLSEMDMVAWLKRRGIPVRKGANPDDAGWEDAVPAQPDPNKPPQPDQKPDANLALLSRWIDGETIRVSEPESSNGNGQHK